MLTAIPYRGVDGSQATITVDLADMTPGGLTPFLVEQTGPQWWRMLADYLFRGPGGAIHVLRRGYGWNGASIPPGLPRLLSKPGDHLSQSGPHDLGYQFSAYETWSPVLDRWLWCTASKSYVDSVFYSQGRADGEGVAKAWTLWDGVHVFGWFSWWFGNCPGHCDKCQPPFVTDCCYKGVLVPTFPTNKGKPLT